MGVHIQQDSDCAFNPASSCHRMINFLDVRPEDVVLHETTYSASAGTGIERRLILLGSRRQQTPALQ
jgi:hypothetical protein